MNRYQTLALMFGIALILQTIIVIIAPDLIKIMVLIVFISGFLFVVTSKEADISLKIFKRFKCEHEFKRYEVLSNNFNVIGWNYSDCIHCGKKWNRLTKEQQQNSKYINDGIDVRSSGGM